MYIACGPLNVYMPRGKRRPSSSARLKVTWPVMSDARSSRFNQRARFSFSTSTAPVPCQPGTEVSSVRRPCTAPPVPVRRRSVSSWLTGPLSDVSNALSTAMFVSPRRTPDHS